MTCTSAFLPTAQTISPPAFKSSLFTSNAVLASQAPLHPWSCSIPRVQQQHHLPPIFYCLPAPPSPCSEVQLYFLLLTCTAIPCLLIGLTPLTGLPPQSCLHTAPRVGKGRGGTSWGQEDSPDPGKLFPGACNTARKEIKHPLTGD